MNIRESIYSKSLHSNYPILTIREDNSTIQSKDNIAQQILDNNYNKIRINGSNTNIIDYILSDINGPQLLSSIIDLLFPNGSNILPLDVQLNLVHYLLINKYYPKYNPQELEYIVNADVNELLILLGPNYVNKPLDHASLLFALLSNKSTPYPNIENVVERYSLISSLNFKTIYNLRKLYYNNNYLDQRYPIYVNIALQDPDPREILFITVNNDNVKYYIEKYGIMIPLRRFRENNPADINLFRHYLSIYDEVFEREQHLTIPDVLDFYDNRVASSYLRKFTNKEIYDKFSPLLDFSRIRLRADLTVGFNTLLTENINWRLNLYTNCANGDYLNLITLLPRREDVYQLDEGDFVLSFGTNDYYSCYTMLELLDTFREVNGEYIFTNPDYHPYQQRNSELGAVRPEFSLKQIRALRRFMERNNLVENDLFVFLQQAFSHIDNQPIRIPRYIQQKTKFNSLSNESKNQVTQFFVWLFFYSMYMRMWKGPGNAYPLKNLNKEGKGLSCKPEERDLNTFVQQGVYDKLKDTWTPETIEYINDLVVINFLTIRGQHFDERLAPNLSSELDLIEYGKACMGYAADNMFATAYYYLNNFYNLNKVIQDYAPELVNLTVETMITLLNDTRNMIATGEDAVDRNNRIIWLETQLDHLSQNKEILPFTMDDMERNVHV